MLCLKPTNVMMLIFLGEKIWPLVEIVYFATCSFRKPKIMEAKKICDVCCTSNTKLESVYSGGLFSKKIAEREVIDKKARK